MPRFRNLYLEQDEQLSWKLAREGLDKSFAQVGLAQYFSARRTGMPLVMRP